jgi:hypothetical protein
MATAKKTNKIETKVTEVKTPTTEDKILGNPIVEKVKTIKHYEDETVKYKITNLQVANKPIVVTGDVVEAFIGCKNLEARKALREGATKVITRDLNGADMYKIEVRK